MNYLVLAPFVIDLIMNSLNNSKELIIYFSINYLIN